MYSSDERVGKREYSLPTLFVGTPNSLMKLLPSTSLLCELSSVSLIHIYCIIYILRASFVYTGSFVKPMNSDADCSAEYF